MKNISLKLAAIGCLGLVLATNVLAAEFRGGKGSAGNISVSSGEELEDLYVAGGNVSVNNEVRGDLMVAGGNVNVDGTVESDLFAAGGSVTINSDVGDDARVAGGSVTINGLISDDLVLAGGNVAISERSTIQGDLILAGGSITINGPVNGNIQIAGGEVLINSTVSGSVNVRAERLEFGERAVVRNQIAYTGQREAVIASGAQVGVINFTRAERENWAEAAAGATLLQVFAMIIAGLVLTLLFRPYAHVVVNNMYVHPLTNLGIGLLVLIVTPIIVTLLFVTVIGYFLALLLLLTYILTLMVAAVLAFVYVGAWIVKLFSTKEYLVADWKAVVLGVLAVNVLYFIPFVGVLVYFVSMLIALGALFLSGYDSMPARQRLTQPAVPNDRVIA